MVIKGKINVFCSAKIIGEMRLRGLGMGLRALGG